MEIARPQQVRDQTLLAVLLDVAPTIAELCALRDDQVLEHRPSGSLVLRVDGPARPSGASTPPAALACSSPAASSPVD